MSPKQSSRRAHGMPWSWDETLGRVFLPSFDRSKGGSTLSSVAQQVLIELESLECECHQQKSKRRSEKEVTDMVGPPLQRHRDESRDSYLVSSLEEAVAKLSSLSTQVARTFLIGGSQLYTQALRTDDESRGKVTRLLITRILSPQFDCDVFLPEFRTPEQISADAQTSPGIATENISSLASPKALPGQEPLPNAKWRKQSSSELGSFLGPEGVEAGVNSEGVVSYEFQMWEPAQI